MKAALWFLAGAAFFVTPQNEGKSQVALKGLCVKDLGGKGKQL